MEEPLYTVSFIYAYIYLNIIFCNKTEEEKYKNTCKNTNHKKAYNLPIKFRLKIYN